MKYKYEVGDVFKTTDSVDLDMFTIIDKNETWDSKPAYYVNTGDFELNIFLTEKYIDMFYKKLTPLEALLENG
jgi:hypothetical protein